jgi:hypothetical protein
MMKPIPYPLVKGAKLTLFLKEWLFELPHGFSLWINEKDLLALAKKILLNSNDENNSYPLDKVERSLAKFKSSLKNRFFEPPGKQNNLQTNK